MTHRRNCPAHQSARAERLGAYGVHPLVRWAATFRERARRLVSLHALIMPTPTPIESPLSGRFYHELDGAALVREGDTVNAGRCIGIIEADGLANEITTPLTGHVVQIVATNGGAVALGSPLLILETTREERAVVYERTPSTPPQPSSAEERGSIPRRPRPYLR